MDDTDSLREVIDLYGLEPAVGVLPQVFPSGSGNRVCHVQTTTGHIAVRRSHPARTRPWLDLEAAVLDHLAQVRFPAVRQYRTAAGQPFIEHAGRFWSVFKYIEASILTRPDDGQLATLAHLQARLHVVLATFPAADRWMDWAGQWRPRKSWAYIVPLADTLAFLEQVAIEPCRAQNLPSSRCRAAQPGLCRCHHRLSRSARPAGASRYADAL